MANELQPLSLLFQNRLFRIPDYQRGYAWQQSQLVDFWDDLNNLQMDRYHYTGLLSLKMLKGSETSSWGNDLWMVEKGFKPCHIVDGQQRLTTFIILLNEIVCFVRNIEENAVKADDEIVLGYETLKDIVAKYICQKRPPQNMITTYLFGYETDNPSEKYLRYQIFNEPNSGEINETYYTKNLKAAKEFFASNVESLYGDEGIEGINALYQKLTQKLMFNLHEIDDDYDVFVAFETMNNRGKRLTNLELLKNRLIYLTTIYEDSKLDEKDKSELRKNINEAWKEVYFQLGRNKTTALSDDDFLKDHWIIYYSYSRKKGDDYIKFLLNKFSARNVFEKKTIIKEVEANANFEEYDQVEEDELEENVEFVEEIVLKLEPKEIADYVNSLKDTAKHWYDTYFPFDSNALTDAEKLWIDRLRRIGMGYFRPLITAALCKTQNESELVNLFKAIERFIFVCFRLANYRSNYQSTVFYSAARDIFSGKATIQSVTQLLTKLADQNIQYAIPNFITDIEKKLSTGNGEGYYAWNCLKYFMYEYEYSLWESTGVKKPSLEMFSKSEKDKVSIEHILPQTPTKWYWRNQFRAYINNQSEMKALTGSIGNLLPLAQSINSSLQNDSFEEKKNPSNQERRGYSSGSNSEIEVAKETDWDAIRIYIRGLKLLSFMEGRWDISLTEEQKDKLTFVGFVNDGREIPEELSMDIIPEPAEKKENYHYRYWEYLLPNIRAAQGGEGKPYSHVNPNSSNYLNGYFGLSSIYLYCYLPDKDEQRCTVGLYIDSGDKEYNNRLFDLLYSNRTSIESKFDKEIIWDRKEGKRAASIYVVLNDVNATDESNWEIMSSFHAYCSKKIADCMVYEYWDEIKALGVPTITDNERAQHIYDLIMRWAEVKASKGEINLRNDKCKRGYARFTTDSMSVMIPNSEKPDSGWGTHNHYFYEIKRTNKRIHMQFALSGVNQSSQIKGIFDEINNYYPAKANTETWEWRHPYAGEPVEIYDEMTDGEIYGVLNEQYKSLMNFESDLLYQLKQEKGEDIE